MNVRRHAIGIAIAHRIGVPRFIGMISTVNKIYGFLIPKILLKHGRKTLL